MDNQVHNAIVSFIWGIADDCLRDVYVRGKYRDVILPMTVIRRLDALLEDTKSAVLNMKKTLDAAKIVNQWPALCNAAGQAFCNGPHQPHHKTDAESGFRGISGRLFPQRSGNSGKIQVPQSD